MLLRSEWVTRILVREGSGGRWGLMASEMARCRLLNTMNFFQRSRRETDDEQTHAQTHTKAFRETDRLSVATVDVVDVDAARLSGNGRHSVWRAKHAECRSFFGAHPAMQLNRLARGPVEWRNELKFRSVHFCSNCNYKTCSNDSASFSHWFCLFAERCVLAKAGLHMESR